MELGLGDYDKEYGYSLPELKIPATSQPKMVNASWGAFKQSWTPKDDYDNELVISGAAAAKMAAQIKFKTQNITGTKGSFNVISIGSYNSCGNP